MPCANVRIETSAQLWNLYVHKSVFQPFSAVTTKFSILSWQPLIYFLTNLTMDHEWSEKLRSTEKTAWGILKFRLVKPLK